VRRRLTSLIVGLTGLGLSACGSTVATSSFKGMRHDVAQGLANLQSHVTAGEQKKICSEDLAAEVVARLGGAKGCEAAVKRLLSEIDGTELTIEHIDLASSGTSATATVKSVYNGKKRQQKVTLLKQGDKWKLSALQ
jgi:hypothetical protein